MALPRKQLDKLIDSLPEESGASGNVGSSCRSSDHFLGIIRRQWLLEAIMEGEIHDCRVSC